MPAQVRGSTIASKRAFLEGKGLTGDEIDESFRRVPEAPAPALPQSGELSQSAMYQRCGDQVERLSRTGLQHVI
jgi:hypothetical protein